MNKKTTILALIAILTTSMTVYAIEANELEPIDSTKQEVKSVFDTDKIYYPNANITSAIQKYKNANYTGCLQELYSLTKKDPSNALAYYYIAMAYAHINMSDQAVAAYEKVIALKPNSYLSEYAEKGRDCLTGGPLCHPEEAEAPAEEQQDNLDKFVNSPYGNGFSPELNNKIKEQQLKNIQNTINKKDTLNNKDLEKIRQFDTKQNPIENKSMNDETDKIAMVSDEEVLNAINTLKSAGVNVSLQNQNYSGYQDPQMAEFSMLLGNNNNNNNSMMNMVPMMMAQYQEGKNIDPRFMQAMLMNSMVNDLNFNNNNY